VLLSLCLHLITIHLKRHNNCNARGECSWEHQMDQDLKADREFQVSCCNLFLALKSSLLSRFYKGNSLRSDLSNFLGLWYYIISPRVLILYPQSFSFCLERVFCGHLILVQLKDLNRVKWLRRMVFRRTVSKLLYKALRVPIPDSLSALYRIGCSMHIFKLRGLQTIPHYVIL